MQAFECDRLIHILLETFVLPKFPPQVRAPLTAHSCLFHSCTIITLPLPPLTSTVPVCPDLPLTANEPEKGGCTVPHVPFGAVTSIMILPSAP